MDAIFCGYLNKLFLESSVFVPSEHLDGFLEYANSIGEQFNGGAMSFDRLGNLIGQFFYI